LAIASTLLKGAMRPREGTQQFMIPQPPAKSVRPSRASARIRASADGGWMSEKYPLLAEEEECFFLTSPFIEPDGLDHLAQGKVLTGFSLLLLDSKKSLTLSGGFATLCDSRLKRVEVVGTSPFNNIVA
jgi:hypothetical protein